MKEHIRQDSQTVTMKANEKTILHLSAKNHRGKETPVGSIPIWTTSDGAVVTLHPSDNGYECVVKGTMKIGRCKVTVEATGSTGKIARTINFDVLSPYADLLDVTQGPITDV